MAKKELTATHTKILDILSQKQGCSKHINYVDKCLGYKNTDTIDHVFTLLRQLKHRGLASMNQQFHFCHETGKTFDMPSESVWAITDKGKLFLEDFND